MYVLGSPRIQNDTDYLRYDQLHESIHSAFLMKLRSGELTATGRDASRPIDSERVVVPPDSWRFLIPNFEDSSAVGGGFAVAGILVTEAQSTRRVTASVKAAKSCREWIKALARQGRQRPRKDDIFAEAKTRFGDTLSRREFERAWADAAPKDWRVAGRKS